MIRSVSLIAAALAFAVLREAPAEAWHHCGHCLRMEQLFTSGAATWDDRTGASIDHFPIERRFDLEHIRLEIDFPALEQREASVREILIISAPWEDLKEVEFQAERLQIGKVLLAPTAALELATNRHARVPSGGTPLSFHHDGSTLRVAFREPLRKGQRAALAIEYDIRNPPFGLNWIEPLPNDPDPRWEVWSQGQPESNRGWFVTHDYPNDFHTSEIVATVPLPNTVSAAGVLVNRSDNGDGTATYHWRMEQPHVSYLTTLVVGQFAVEREDHRGVALEYYVPPFRAADIGRTFRRTADMMDVFARLFDEPYPYPRYAQLVVREFTAGGMENVTATTLTSRVMQDASADRHARACGSNMEGLIAHELAHQWFGDLITCRTWSHLWLNEGWASYCEELWVENACGREFYEAGLWRRRNGIARNDRVEHGRPLVFIRTPDANTMFGFNGAAVYNKGAYVLHMLREHLGDEAFFAGVARYIDRHKFGTAITDDFRTALEEVSGRDLEAWFRQWTERPGTPQLTISMDFLPATNTALVTVEQTQPISVDTPAFRGDLLLHFETSGGRVTRETVRLAERRHTFRIPLDATPKLFAPDPQGAFLAGYTIRAGDDVLAATADSGPTTFARLDAIQALERSATPRAVEALRRVAHDARSPVAIRQEAVGALGRMRTRESREAVIAVADAALDRPEQWSFQVRASIATALASAREEQAVPRLMRFAEDPADVVAQNAANSLGTMLRGDSIDDTLLALARRRGDHDRILSEAMNALLRRNSPMALDAALMGAEPGADYRIRRDAVRILGEALSRTDGLSDDHPGLARVLEVLEEPRRGTSREAVVSLGKARWKPAIAPLEAISRTSTDEDLARQAREAMDSINAGSNLRDEVRRLAERVSELERSAEESSPRERRKDAPAPDRKRRRFLGIF